MTVQELIDILKKQDRTLRVMLQGYEGGLCDVNPSLIETNEVALDIDNHKDHWYYGPHEFINGYGAEYNKGVVNALIIGR